MAGLTTYLIILFLSTLPIIPHPSIERGHFRPQAIYFPAALSVIPRKLFTTQTPRSWEVARCVQYLVWAWGMVTCVEALRRTIERVKVGMQGSKDPKGPESPKVHEREAKTVPVGDRLEEPPKEKVSTRTIETETETTSMSTSSSKPPDTVSSPSSTSTSTSSTSTTFSSYLLIPKPLLTTLILYLISWRLATTLILPNLPGAWKWPFDATTLLGLGTGLASSWTEVWRLLQLAGFVHTSHDQNDQTDQNSNGPETRRPSKLYKGLHALMSGHRLLLAIRVISATLDRSGEIKPLPGLTPTA